MFINKKYIILQLMIFLKKIIPHVIVPVFTIIFCYFLNIGLLVSFIIFIFISLLFESFLVLDDTKTKILSSFLIAIISLSTFVYQARDSIWSNSVPKIDIFGYTYNPEFNDESIFFYRKKTTFNSSFFEWWICNWVCKRS